MRDEENYGDLARLFAAEDARLDAAVFTKDVMKRIRRQAMVRRLTVGGLGLFGAAIALLQLPELLSAFVGVDDTVSAAMAVARMEISAAMAGNPLWLAIAAGAVMCVFAVSALERA